jgi:methylaspartate mutase epsilon subunit
MADHTESSFRIAFVGGGPRAVSVLERLACRLSETAQAAAGRPVTIYLIDDTQVGVGRIWRTDQSPWLIMNTISTEVTMFSGLAEGNEARPGAGLSLADWWRSAYPGDPERHRYGPYAPRYLFGKYLGFVLDVTDADLARRGVTLRRVSGTVTRILRARPGSYRVLLRDGTTLHANRVVLATGQSRVRLNGTEGELADAARACEDLSYFPGDSAADIELERIPPGERIGVIGMGLGFYDVVASLTLGRGGDFREAGHGKAVYCPSGSEPRIVASSRSGVPFLARGKNEKPPDFRYRPRLLTRERVLGTRPGGQLNFAREVFPWVAAEVNLVYFETLARLRGGPQAAAEFGLAVLASLEAGGTDPAREVGKVAATFGLHDEPLPDLQALAWPFSERSYESHAAFTTALLSHLQRDLSLALRGNVSNPLKAALETLRDVRGVIRSIMEFADVSPDSYQSDFVGFFAPLEALLTAGPPTARVIELLALIEAGIITIAGPRLRIRPEHSRHQYLLWSPQVRDASFAVRTIVDSRLPKTDVRRDQSPVIRHLIEDGVIRAHTLRGSPPHFSTGGVDVTPRPFHPIGRDGRPDPHLYVLGQPTEGPRWYTQIGSGRPGFWNDFTRDADSVAVDLTAAVVSG